MTRNGGIKHRLQALQEIKGFLLTDTLQNRHTVVKQFGMYSKPLSVHRAEEWHLQLLKLPDTSHY